MPTREGPEPNPGRGTGAKNEAGKGLAGKGSECLPGGPQWGQARPLSDWQMRAALDKETHVPTGAYPPPSVFGERPNWVSLFGAVSHCPEPGAANFYSVNWHFCSADLSRWPPGCTT